MENEKRYVGESTVREWVRDEFGKLANPPKPEPRKRITLNGKIFMGSVVLFLGSSMASIEGYTSGWAHYASIIPLIGVSTLACIISGVGLIENDFTEER